MVNSKHSHFWKVKNQPESGHILRAVHTSSCPALHNPGGFPGMAT
jgi:hypothetical protein